VGAAVNGKADNVYPTSLTGLARSLLPKELRGLLPTSPFLATSTFETPQVAFAYERQGQGRAYNHRHAPLAPAVIT
jgi:hypothetical protein